MADVLPLLKGYDTVSNSKRAWTARMLLHFTPIISRKMRRGVYINELAAIHLH